MPSACATSRPGRGCRSCTSPPSTRRTAPRSTASAASAWRRASPSSPRCGATGLAVLTDVHEKEQVAAVAAVVDVLQTPAFLCRQPDFIVAVAAAGKPVNLKKGQFLSPGEMERVVEKARSTGNQDLLVTERG